MSDAPPPRTPPTAAWLAEQQAKQAAYAARRRAWTEEVRRAAEAPVEEGLVRANPEAITSAPDRTMPQRRPRGVVHDARQRRLEF